MNYHVHNISVAQMVMVMMALLVTNTEGVSCLSVQCDPP